MRGCMKQMAVATAMSLISAVALAQSVKFAEPLDGATVSSPFKVRFAVDGMEIKPAGDMAPNTGHHHLLINAAPIKAGEAVPADATHIHYGKGQTETMVTLPPGNYTLTMQFANGAHQSYGEAMAQTVKVTVK